MAVSIPSSDPAINIDRSRSIWRVEEHEIHFVEDVGGHVWFCAKDLASYFGYFKNGNPCAGSILRKVSKDEWKRKFGEIERTQPAPTVLSCTDDKVGDDKPLDNEPRDDEPRDDELRYVIEFGFYEIIMASEKPNAIAFKQWVCESVLPQLRRTGTFSIVPQEPREDVRRDIDLLEERMKALERLVDGLGRSGCGAIEDLSTPKPRHTKLSPSSEFQTIDDIWLRINRCDITTPQATRAGNAVASFFWHLHRMEPRKNDDDEFIYRTHDDKWIEKLLRQHGKTGSTCRHSSKKHVHCWKDENRHRGLKPGQTFCDFCDTAAHRRNGIKKVAAHMWDVTFVCESCRHLMISNDS
jgi:prophage antirepressor-like protein